MPKAQNDYLELLVLRCLAQLPDFQARGIADPPILAETMGCIEQERRSRGLSAERRKQLDAWTRAICPDPEEVLAGFVDGKP